MLKKSKLSAGIALAFGGALAAGVLSVHAQEAQRIEITGSSIKRIDAETALPVTIITREEIASSGASNVQELLDRVSSNNGGGRSLGESIGESSAPGQTGASLRALGRERTLVLLNGRRLSAYPFSGLGVDLNSIPLSAVERIEILRDGASAVYGSDAIGGVINFITRRDFKGGELSASYEQPQKKGGTVASASGGFGFGDLAKDRFNVLGTFSFQKYEVVKAADRDFSTTGNRPDLGIVKFSSNTFPAQAYLLGPTQQVFAVSKYPTCEPPDSFPYLGGCRYDYTHYIDIYPESERAGALARANFQLDKDTLLFAEVAYSKNSIIFGLSQTPSVTTGKPIYTYPGGGKWYPTAAVDAVRPGYRGDLRIAWRIVDGGQRRSQVDNDTTRLVLGAEGVFAGWDYKAGFATTDVNATSSFLSGQYSDTLLRAALKTGLVNPFGPNDAAGLAELKKAELTGTERSSKTSNTGFDVQFSKELFKFGSGMAAVAFGAEMRKEKYNDGYSALASSGDIVGGSGNQGAVTGKRDTNGIFAELTLPLMKGLDLTAAVRHDSYKNTSGESRDGKFTSPDTSATSPKVSVRFQPTKSLLVRASYGKGFRMPALDNLYAPASFTNTGGQWTDPFYDAKVGCAKVPDPNRCDAQLYVLNEPNPALKPEKSDQLSIGLVFEPMRDLTLGVDYFDIKIKNGIGGLSGDSILYDWYARKTGAGTSSSIYANRLVKDADGYLDYVRGSLENLSEARVAGYDLSAKYRLRTGVGTFTPSWEGTYTTKSTTTNSVTGAVGNNLAVYSRGGPTLRFKQVLSVGWEQGAWGANVRYYSQSGYEDYDGVSKVSQYDIVNLRATYRGFKNMTLSAGVRNLLDRKPPVSVQEDYFQVGFDPTYTDVKGRTFTVGIDYKF